MGILYGASSCLLVKAGITKLSELEIDADKDWGGYGIANLKELVSGMQKGSILQRGNAGVLENLAPGAISFELTSGGPGDKVDWKAPPMP